MLAIKKVAASIKIAPSTPSFPMIIPAALNPISSAKEEADVEKELALNILSLGRINGIMDIFAGDESVSRVEFKNVNINKCQGVYLL